MDRAMNICTLRLAMDMKPVTEQQMEKLKLWAAEMTPIFPVKA
jgi:hypothetical protein